MSANRLQQLLQMLIDEPDDLFINYSLGLEYASISDLASAENYLLKCMALKEDYIPAYYQLAKLYSKNGREEEAKASLLKGLQFCKAQNNQKARNEFEEALFLLD